MKPTYKELWSLIAALDEDFTNFRVVRRLKAVGKALELEQQQVPA